MSVDSLSLAKTSSALGDDGPMLPEKLRKAGRFWAGAIGGRAVGSWGARHQGRGERSVRESRTAATASGRAPDVAVVQATAFVN
jgi:hypothetical protein